MGSLLDHLQNWQFYPFHGKGRLLWQISWVATVWSIWLERNNRCFRNKVSSIGDLSNLIRWRSALRAIVLPKFRSYSAGVVQELVDVNKDHPNILSMRISWQPPPRGVLKQNFDGSAHGAPASSGMDWVIKNDRNESLPAFSGPAAFGFAYATEAAALLFGIKLVKERNFLPDVIEGNLECHQFDFS